VDMISTSNLYETRPVGGPPQGDFLNGVIKIETSLSPEDLLGLFKGIEKGMGREESPRDHPRIIDLDILMYDDRVFAKDDIEIPHPRMHERGFVLRGLAEIAPDAIHPVTGKTVWQLFQESISIQA